MVGNIYRYNFNPQNTAVKYKDTLITYEQLDTMVQKYATYFSNIGIRKGDKVILSCINSPEFIYSYLSIVKLGAIVVPINIFSTLDEISYMIENSEAKIMIVHPIMLKTNINKQAIQNIFNVNVIVLDKNFNNEINKITEYKFEEVNDENLVSSLFYTSGTTGRPKAAMLTHRNLISNVVQFSNTVNFSPEDNFMCILPMFYVFGFTICVLTPLYHGSTITILDTFNPQKVIESLIKDEITIFAGVPSMYVALLEVAKSDIKIPKLRLAISGGASLPVEVFRRVREKLSFPIIEGYGLSEASPAVTLNPVNGVQKPGSIGLPIHGVECKVVDENGNEVPVGEIGELIVKGNNVMIGYYKQDDKTKETLKDGWLYTGDLAKKDTDGYYYIVGRKKDLIIVGGLTVYPKEVEEVLYQHPKVKEAIVIGMDDKLHSEYVKAFVVLKEGEECTFKELLAHLKQHLASHKLPREIEFIDELPKNSTGKILKIKLKN